MEVEVGVAKVGKYAVGVCGDSVEVVERPCGGISVVIVDGQGHGRAAKRTSHMIATKAANLIEDGARDGAVMRVVNDHLYAFRDGQVSATATILTADLDHSCLVVSRNSNSPVVVGSPTKPHCIDSQVEPIGVRRLIKPAITHYELAEGMILIGFTDGVIHAGRYGGKVSFSYDWVYKELNKSDSVHVLAGKVLDYAINLDGGQPKDDMVVAVLKIGKREDRLGIRRMWVSYPY